MPSMELAALVSDRRAARRALGPRPAWWRRGARRAWDAAERRLVTVDADDVWRIFANAPDEHERRWWLARLLRDPELPGFALMVRAEDDLS